VTHLEDKFGDEIISVDSHKLAVDETKEILQEIIFKKHLKLN